MYLYWPVYLERVFLFDLLFCLRVLDVFLKIERKRLERTLPFATDESVLETAFVIMFLAGFPLPLLNNLREMGLLSAYL